MSRFNKTAPTDEPKATKKSVKRSATTPTAAPAEKATNDETETEANDG